MKKEEIKTEEFNTTDCCGNKYFMKRHSGHYHGKNNGNAIYGLGIIGALFYFLQNASTFSLVLIGIGKSIFWPAILMFKLLTYLNM